MVKQLPYSLAFVSIDIACCGYIFATFQALSLDLTDQPDRGKLPADLVCLQCHKP